MSEQPEALPETPVRKKRVPKPPPVPDPPPPAEASEASAPHRAVLPQYPALVLEFAVEHRGGARLACSEMLPAFTAEGALAAFAELERKRAALAAMPAEQLDALLQAQAQARGS